MNFCQSRRHFLIIFLTISVFSIATAFAAAFPSAASQSGPVSGQADEPVSLTVLDPTPGATVVRLDFGPFSSKPVDIEGRSHLSLRLTGEARTFDKGMPSLPRVCRSVVVPDDRAVNVTVVEASYHEIEGVLVAPSKGILKRSVDPESVPYTFADFYGTDAWYPQDIATCSEPFIVRDVRGVTIAVHPLRYNPVGKTLRVYESITIEVSETGPGVKNLLNRAGNFGKAGISGKPSQPFSQILDGQFVNYAASGRYPLLNEFGELLIITHDAFAANVKPLADWKNSTGIATTLVKVSTIGNDSASIQAYIQNFYDTHNLAFVLLVGDAAEVATLKSSGSAADPLYALVAGSDNYPDIFVGRFSAQTVAEVNTQVRRTIAYERSSHQEAWYLKGTGIASNQGPGHYGEFDDEHMGFIRNDLISYGYTQVDELYDPGVTAADVGAAVNEGRGIINYCGHGCTSAWSSSGFSSWHVDMLTNDGKLPFITSVACLNGAFENGTCFAETWLRATNGAAATGAIGMYASSVSQSWDPPMEAQDEFIDRYVDGSYGTFGALCFAGSSKMMDRYGAYGRTEFNHWHVFGDPSLRVRPISPFMLSADTNPVQSGQTVTFTVENARPLKDAMLAYSNAGPGSTPVPWLGLTLTLANPRKAAAPVQADASGTVTWSLPVPTSVQGAKVWFQALQYGRVTNVLATSIQ